MKRANVKLFSCKTFKKNLGAYVDNEISGSLKAEFITHASQCNSCNGELSEMEGVVRALSRLEQVTTSQDFDISLKTRILLEKNRLRNPFYRFSLFFREKIRYFLAVPAFAMVVFLIVFLYSGPEGNYFHDNLARDMVSSQNSGDRADIEELNPDEIVYVYYVLETIHSTEDTRMRSLTDSDGSTGRMQTTNSFATVSF